MDNRLILIVGGARSGKSSFAQEMARAHGGRVTCIVTAKASDVEMAARIAAHRATRPDSWRVVEEPLALAEAVASCRGAADVVLIDCLTVHLSNLLLARTGFHGTDTDPEPPAGLAGVLEAETDRFIRAAKDLPALVIAVANEVGEGMVPYYRLGRFFRDAAGRANQQIARAADRVYLVRCGLAVELKGSAIAPEQALRDLREM